MSLRFASMMVRLLFGQTVRVVLGELRNLVDAK